MREQDGDLDAAVDVLLGRAWDDEAFADRLHSSTHTTLAGERELTDSQRVALRQQPADDLLVALTRAGLPLPRGLAARLSDGRLRDALSKIARAARADARYADDLRVMPQVAMALAPGLTDEQKAVVRQTPVTDMRLLLAAAEAPQTRSRTRSRSGIGPHGTVTSNLAGTTTWWSLGYVAGSTARTQQLTGDVDVAKRGAGALGFQSRGTPTWSLKDQNGNPAQTEGYYWPLKTQHGKRVSTQPDDPAADNVSPGLTASVFGVDGADAHISFEATWYNMPITGTPIPSSGQMWLFGDAANPLSFVTKGASPYYDTIGFSKGAKQGGVQDAGMGQLALGFFPIAFGSQPNKDPVLHQDGQFTTLVAVPLMLTPDGIATTLTVFDCTGARNHVYPLDVVSTGPGNGWAGGICLGTPDTVFAAYRYLKDTATTSDVPAVVLLTRFDQLQTSRPYPIFSFVRVLSSDMGYKDGHFGHFTGLAFREFHGAIPNLGPAQDWVVMFGCGGTPGVGGNLFLAVIPKGSFGDAKVPWSYLTDITSKGVLKWNSYPDPGQPNPQGDETSESLFGLVESTAQLKEISVGLVRNLSMWIMLHEDEVVGKGSVFFRFARDPWGPWSDPELIFTAQDAYQSDTSPGYVHNPNGPPDGLDGPSGIKADGLPYFPRLVEEFTTVWPAPDGSPAGAMMVMIYWSVSGGGPYYAHLLTSTFLALPPPPLALSGSGPPGNHPPGHIGQVGGGPILKQ